MNDVAATILAQIGGRRALVMTGGAVVPTEGTELQFTIRGCRKANRVRVVLDAGDTYTLELWKDTKPRMCRTTYTYKEGRQRRVLEIRGLYCDGLADTIERHTGLYLSL